MGAKLSDQANVSEDGTDGTGQKRAAGVFRLGRTAYRIWSYLGSNAGAAVSSAVGSAAVIGAMAATTPELLGLAERPDRVRVVRTVETRQLDQTSLVYPLEGRDAAGRRVLFDLVVLSRDLAWARGSDRELTLGGQSLPEAETARRIFGAELTAALGAAKEVIAVGLASIEGSEAAEADRAARRAATAAGWVEKVVPAAVPITALNLGQFRAECSAKIAGDTGWQRPLMVIAVKERQGQADVKEALADALTGKTNLPSPACYTRYDMQGVR
jgi:hypothetical protein